MTILHKRAVIFSIAALALSSASWSAAAQNYPDKPIKIIVAVAAGGPMDTMARAIAQQMQMRLGQPVVIENRPGAGTTIGAKAVFQAEPDGLTLLWGTLSMVAIAPVLYKDLDYDPKGLVPVALVAEFPSLLVVPPDLPVQHDGGLHRLRQSPPRQAELRRLARHAADADGRDLQQGRRPRHDLCALPAAARRRCPT